MTPLNRRLYATARTVHIYLTIVGLAMLLFFAATGLMLNHPSLFGIDDVAYRDIEGQIPPAWLDPVDDLRIVEHLRERYDVKGAVRAFDTDDREVRITFRRPGHYLADATIERPGGRLTMTIETHGLAALLVDLHRGSDAGGVWSIFVIDAAAVVLTVVSVTGFVMLVILPRYRRHALVGLALSAVAGVLLYAVAVP